MRKLRPRLLLALTSVAALALWVACGDDGNDANVLNPGIDSGNPDIDLPDVKTVPPDVVTTPPSGPDRDAGTPTLLDAGPAADGGIPCFFGGILESEENDTLETADELPVGSLSANVIKRVICGFTNNPTFDGGAANIDAGDKEILTFTIGDASADFYLRFDGNVVVTIETDGQAPIDIAQPNVVLPRVYGQPYFVRVKSKDGATQKWKIILFEDQADAGR